MPRPPRYALPGIPQHVLQRGNNRQPVFFCEDDYRFYLASVKLAAEQHGIAVHAYVLMTNHVHLLVTPQQADGIAKLMQSIGRPSSISTRLISARAPCGKGATEPVWWMLSAIFFSARGISN